MATTTLQPFGYRCATPPVTSSSSQQQQHQQQQPGFSLHFLKVAVLLLLLDVFLGVTVVEVGRRSYRDTIKPKLTFQEYDPSSLTAKSYSFRILQVADIHLGENAWEDWGPIQDHKTRLALKRILSHEKPDLIVFSGDQVTANNVDADNATEYIDDLIKEVVEPLGIPWATIFGNHDDMGFEDPQSGEVTHPARKSRYDLALQDASSHFLSLTQIGPSHLTGVSNYWLNIYLPKQSFNFRHSIDDPQPAARILLLDSGGGSLPQQISVEQVEWFQEENNKYGNNVPIVAFQHIPSADFTFDSTRCASSNKDNSYNATTTMSNDTLTPLEYDAGIVAALQADGNVHFLAVGHDHGNDYCCQMEGEEGDSNRKGLHLCFGRHSGYGGYGRWDRGARVYNLQIELDMEASPSVPHHFSWSSYVRMESGEIIDKYSSA